MTKYRTKKLPDGTWSGMKDGQPYAFFTNRVRAQAWVWDMRRVDKLKLTGPRRRARVNKPAKTGSDKEENK